MDAKFAAEFPVSPDTAELNHASYGLASRETLEWAAAKRNWIEGDPNGRLGSSLVTHLAESTDRFAQWAGLAAGQLVLTTNGTDSLASILASLRLDRTSHVGVLSTEYSAVRRAWEVVCTQTGARCQELSVEMPNEGHDGPIPPSTWDLVRECTHVQVSLIASSTALRLPAETIRRIRRTTNGLVLADAAHAPGHISLADIASDVDIMFGSLHKWLPIARSVGFVWTAPDLDLDLRPAQISLNWDSESTANRFGWPGTFDPVPRLSVPTGLHQYDRWSQSGRLAYVEDLAIYTVEMLAELGAVPTFTPAYSSPRMKAFFLPGVERSKLKTMASRLGVRAWVGSDPSGCVLRVSMHVYNDESDADKLRLLVRKALADRRR